MSKRYHYFIITYKDTRTDNENIEGYSCFDNQYSAWKQCTQHAIIKAQATNKYLVIKTIEKYNTL